MADELDELTARLNKRFFRADIATEVIEALRKSHGYEAVKYTDFFGKTVIEVDDGVNHTFISVEAAMS